MSCSWIKFLSILSWAWPDHLLRTHPLIKLLSSHTFQLQRRLFQGGSFSVGCLGNLRRHVITNVLVQGGHQHEALIHQLLDVLLVCLYALHAALTEARCSVPPH